MRGLIWLTFLISALVHGADRPSADLLSDPFFESYQPEVNVSGNVIVGVMSATAGSSLVSDELSVHTAGLPEITDICLRATSSDGIYTSRNHYRLPANSPDTIHLPYPSGRGEVLSEYDGADIAISANAGDCENTSSDYLVVTPLNSGNATTTRIYLNSFGATDVFYEIVGYDRAPQACEYISEGRRTTYDFFCDVTAVDDSVVDVSIIRERFGREQPGVDLKLVGVGQ